MTKGSKKNKKGKSKKYKKKSNKNNHTHKIISHKHNGNDEHVHKIDNANYDVNFVVGDYNSVDNKHIVSKIGGMDITPSSPRSSPRSSLQEPTMSVEKRPLNNISLNNSIVTGRNDNVITIGTNNRVNNYENIIFPPTPPSQEKEKIDTEEEKMEIDEEEDHKIDKILEFTDFEYILNEENKEKEDHEIDEILEYIDFEYILSEKNIENIMDYISYCVYQWELYKDYMIPKDEYYQNMIDELYNDSLYTNNIDKDYDFISDEKQFMPDEKQSGGNDERKKRSSSPSSEKEEQTPKKLKLNEEKKVEMDVTILENETTSEEMDVTPPEEEQTPEEEEKINIIKDIFSKNDNYHDFLKGTRAVYLQPPPNYDEKIKNKIDSLLAPQNKTQSFNQDDVLNEYSKILQNHPHSEGSVLKGTLSLEGIETKKTFSSYIKDDELEKFIDEMNKPENTDKKNSILNNYFAIPKISQKENGDLALEDNYIYFIRKDENPKNNYKMLQNICKDMGLTYTVCLGVFLNELVRECSTVYPITILDSLDYFKSYSNQFLVKIKEKSTFPFLEEIKTLAKKMDPIVRSPNQTVDESFNDANLIDIYIFAYQLVLKYLFGITDERSNVEDINDDIINGVKFIFEEKKTIDFYFTTNTVEIVSEAIVSIIDETVSMNTKVNHIINTAKQIYAIKNKIDIETIEMINTDETKNEIIMILTKLKTQGDLYQVITAYLINIQYPNNPISFYTEDRLCLSIAFMINNFLKEEVPQNSKPLNVFFKASSGQYEDETDKENILMDTKMNKEVTVCSSEMLLTTKNDYILMCKNEISKVQQDFIKFRDRFKTILGNEHEYTPLIINVTSQSLEFLTDLDERLNLDKNNVVNETDVILDIQNDSTDETDKETNSYENTSSEITPEDRKKIDIIGNQVADLHSLIAFNENISDTFLEYAFTRSSTGIMDTIKKKVFKTNVPISKQFTHFGNFKVKSWMEWNQDNSGINKYLKENLNSLKERKNKIKKALSVSTSTYFNGIFTQFLGEFTQFLGDLKTKSDALIQAFFNDFEKKITELKQPSQNKRTGMRVKKARNQSTDTSTIEDLSDEKEDINSNIAKLEEEKSNIIENIKKPIMDKIEEKEQEKTQEQKNIILSTILEKILKQRKLVKKEQTYIPTNILEQYGDLSDKLTRIKNTMKDFSKKLISCAKKILTEKNKIAEPIYVPEEVKNDLKSYLDSEKLSSSFKDIFTKPALSLSTPPATLSTQPLPPKPPKGGKHKKSRKRRARLNNNNKKTKRKISKRSKRTKKKNKKSSKKYKITHKKKQYKD